MLLDIRQQPLGGTVCPFIVHRIRDVNIYSQLRSDDWSFLSKHMSKDIPSNLVFYRFPGDCSVMVHSSEDFDIH
jgi:hypothetical protein